MKSQWLQDIYKPWMINSWSLKYLEFPLLPAVFATWRKRVGRSFRCVRAEALEFGVRLTANKSVTKILIYMTYISPGEILLLGVLLSLVAVRCWRKTELLCFRPLGSLSWTPSTKHAAAEVFMFLSNGGPLSDSFSFAFLNITVSMAVFAHPHPSLESGVSPCAPGGFLCTRGPRHPKALCLTWPVIFL